MPALLQPNQVGIREDLADYIAVVDAKSTPFSSMIPKGKELGNMAFDWQVDNYDVIKLGGVVDGTDMTLANLTNASANRTRLENYAQVFQRDFRVGFVAETQNVAGVSDEVARSVSKRMLEMKRDIEATLLLGNQLAQKDDGSVPYLTSSLGMWLSGDVSQAPTNTPAQPVSTAKGAAANTATFTPQPPATAIGRPTAAFATPATSKYSGTAAGMVEKDVQDVLTSIYNETGTIRSYDLICGVDLKRAFTNLIGAASVQAVSTNNIVATAVRTFNMDLSEDHYRHAVDVFEGDFGTLMLHPDVFVGKYGTGVNSGTFAVQTTQGYVIPMEMCEMRYTQLPKVQDLPDLGGGPAKLIRAIAGLVVKNPRGFGVFNAT